jgi:glycosyltransferase involved in cell wall biosynthesis
MAGPFVNQLSTPAKLSAAGGERKPLTVLQMVDGHHLGGAERAAREVATAIIAAGGRALIAAGGSAAHRVRVAGAETFAFSPEASLLNRRGNVADLIEIVEDAGVDIIHARSPDMAATGAKAAAALGAKLVTTFHQAHSSGFMGGAANALAAGERVIAVSDSLADAVASKSLPRDRITVIPRGADMNVFAEEVVGPARTIQLADEWGLTEDTRPIVLAPGRLDASNGHEVLLKAVAELKATHDEDAFLCLIVGEGDPKYIGALEEKVLKAGLGGVVRVAGRSEDMPAALKLAAVVVSAATEPPSAGRTMIETQAMGRPVIAPAHGAMLDVVDGGVSGWLTTPGDASELAQAISEALAMDESQRAHIGMAGRGRVRARFTLDAMLNANLAIYEELAATTFRPLVA